MTARYAAMPQERLEQGNLWAAAVQPQEIESIRLWRNAQIDILRQKAPISAEEQQAYYATHVWPVLAAREPANILLGYHENDRLIGYGGLVHIAWEHRRAEVSFLLDPALMTSAEAYGPYIRAFLGLTKRLAFRDLAITRLVTECYATRPGIIALLESEGFRREGELRKHVRVGGRPVDSILHGWLAEDAITLASATAKDCERLWRWRNDPETRVNSLNTGEISWQSHQDWFEKTLRDPTRIILIGCIEGIAVGMCRFDIAGGTAEVSIGLDPALRGRGLGAPLLALAVARFREQRRLPLFATVKKQNAASARCFERCGFTPMAGDGASDRYGLDIA